MIDRRLANSIRGKSVEWSGEWNGCDKGSCSQGNWCNRLSNFEENWAFNKITENSLKNKG